METQMLIDEPGVRDGVELMELGKNLMAAARAGNIETVVDLMRYGAPFATDWWGMTALHHAAQKGHLEMVKLLIRSGILKDTRSKVDKTPLHLACQEGHADVAKYLMANGAEVGAIDMIFMTPLHWAVEMNQFETAEVLMQNGANPHACNKFDKTCIDIAEDQNNETLLMLLMEGPKRGPHTVTNNSDFVADVGKKRIYINTSPLKARRTATPAVVKKVQVQKLPEEEEMWQYLEEHGIEMLEGEDVNLVAAAVGSGQSVVLTEAGRQALNLTELNKQRALASNTTGSSVVGTIKLSTPAPPSNAMKRPHSPCEDVMTQLTLVSKKYFEAKREADQLRRLYAKKKREAAEYHFRMKTILNSLKNSDSQNLDLPSDEDEGLEEEEVGEEEDYCEEEEDDIDLS